MKIALLAPASSIHVVRWANGLSKTGAEVHVISQHSQLEPMNDNVQVHILPFRGSFGYFTMVPCVKKILARIQPDIINAHYASGYGTTATLVNYHPYILSVWGSDVYDFPYLSPIHRLLVRTNLMASDRVASTSLCMAKETNKLTPNLKDDIAITPFGVDVKYYDSLTTPLSKRKNSTEIVIGTVKSLAPKYGIDTLIKSFSLIIKDFERSHPEIVPKLKLRIVGDGPQYSELKKLTKQLNISNNVDFIGRVKNSDVPHELNRMDIYVALSRLDSESFGVAIIEAGAAGIPVVVSNAGGLPEVVVHKKTGLVVPRDNPRAAANAISHLILNEDLRINIGEQAKQHVKTHYDWESCVKKMINLYTTVIHNYNTHNKS